MPDDKIFLKHWLVLGLQYGSHVSMTLHPLRRLRRATLQNLVFHAKVHELCLAMATFAVNSSIARTYPINFTSPSTFPMRSRTDLLSTHVLWLMAFSLGLCLRLQGGPRETVCNRRN